MMRSMNHTKASNAIISTVDYYSSAIADLNNQLKAKEELIRQLGEQIKNMGETINKLARHEEIENSVLSAAVDYFRSNDDERDMTLGLLLNATHKMIEANEDANDE